MKVLTAAQMREIDRMTIEAGTPSLLLMENAGLRVVEFLQERFAPLERHRVVVICGKGNNGGDGFVVARQIFMRRLAAALHVVLACDPGELRGDAAANYQMLAFTGCPVHLEVTPEMHAATIVVDALLGTGMRGPATGRVAELIHEINSGFPAAKVVAVDIPSGLSSDEPISEGEWVRADYTVTFTAPKVGQSLPPGCDRTGELRVVTIGTPPRLTEDDDRLWLSISEASDFHRLLAPRAPGGHKGAYGHVLVMAGSFGKTGAAAMSGLAALRSGAGLVTVASTKEAVPVIAGHAPELMTEALPGNADGKDVIAIGPGLGASEEAQALIRKVVSEYPQPVVVDADALWPMPLPGGDRLRVLTPHPGEMARLTGKTTAEVQADRVGVARDYAMRHHAVVVLKGQRTIVAFPDGKAWINPTGTPAMGKGGSGDILTGMIAGFLAQFPNDTATAVRAAVYLHGLAGQLAADDLGDKCVLATDLLAYLPEAIHVCAGLPD